MAAEQDRALWAAQQRAKVINSYSRTALRQGQGISASAYLKAIFSPDTDAFEPYGRKTKQPHTEVGLAEGFRVQGPHDEFKLAIGASYSKQLLPGKGGPYRYAKEKLEEYRYIEESVRQGVRDLKQGAQELREGASEAVEQVRAGVKGLEGEAKGKGGKLKKEADKLSGEAKKQERKERRESGWRSSAFDWSNDDVDL